MGNAELEQHILAACEDRWLKVARIVVVASRSAGFENTKWGHDAVARRVRRLVKRQKLDAVGDLYNWRASEVRIRQAVAD